MPITRAKATSLLNATEMGLYDASRANALRGHTDAQLGRLVTRARTARDRARGLEKRSRLALRARTGSKGGRSGQANARSGDKAELLADILQRLEGQHKDVIKRDRAAAKSTRAVKTADKASSRAAPTSKRSTTAAATRKTPSDKSKADELTKRKTASARSVEQQTLPRNTSASKKSVARKTAATSKAKSAAGRGATGANTAAVTNKVAKKTVVKKATKKTAKAADRAISPKKALANTRRLLDRHNAQAHAAKPWQHIGEADGQVSEAGYQSDQAALKALELHAGQSRLPAIQGSISTRDRKNQGKRDQRGDS